MVIPNVTCPEDVRQIIKNLEYEYDDNSEYTVKSARITLETGKAHCMEGALAAALLMEQLEYPPLIMFLHLCNIGHAVYAFKDNLGWRSINQSRHDSLKRKREITPLETTKALAYSYICPFNAEGYFVRGWKITDYNKITDVDWRNSDRDIGLEIWQARNQEIKNNGGINLIPDGLNSEDLISKKREYPFIR